MDWKNVLSTVAPALGTAIAGPLGGIAVAMIAKALGLSEQTEQAVAQAISGATPDDLLKLKQADQQFAKDMKALDVDFARIEADDRNSARQMMVQTKAWTPSVLSWLIVAATLGLEGYILLQGIPVQVSELVAGRILGTLDTSFGVVLAYWLGTSMSSRHKDETLARAVK